MNGDVEISYDFEGDKPLPYMAMLSYTNADNDATNLFGYGQSFAEAKAQVIKAFAELPPNEKLTL